jgi:5-methylcytosine-specific restriction endonuclease McrA
MKKPEYLTECDPSSRTYPLDWKVAYYRLHGGAGPGYECPSCKQVFAGADAFEALHADHKIPYSEGGRTTWDNLQLLCGPCNLSKSGRRRGWGTREEDVAAT